MMKSESIYVARQIKNKWHLFRRDGEPVGISSPNLRMVYALAVYRLRKKTQWYSSIEFEPGINGMYEVCAGGQVYFAFFACGHWVESDFVDNRYTETERKIIGDFMFRGLAEIPRMLP